MQWTQSNEKTAIHCLSSQNWNLELACDAYYQNPQLYMCMADMVDQRSLHAFFLKYANSTFFFNLLMLTKATDYFECSCSLKSLYKIMSLNHVSFRRKDRSN